MSKIFNDKRALDFAPLMKKLKNPANSDFDNDQHSMALYNRIIEEYPQFTGTTIAFVNCQGARGPADGRRLRRHAGTHPDIMQSVSKALPDSEFHKMIEKLKDWYGSGRKQGRDFLFLFVRRKNNHRSVAARSMMFNMLREMG